MEDGIDLDTWLDDAGLGYLGVAGCLTLVTGTDERSLLEAFGARLDEPLTLDDVIESMVRAVGVVACGDGLIAFEINGFEGTRPDVLSPASQRGRAASIYWNVEGVVRLTCADEGRMHGSEELLVLDDSCSLPTELVPDLVAAFDREEDMVLPGLRAAERFTALSTQALVVDDDVAMYPLLTVLPDLDPVDPEHLGFSDEAPSLATQILAASPGAQRSLAEWAAYQAVLRVELDDDPRVEAVLRGFGLGPAASFDPAAGVLLEVRNRIEVLGRTDDAQHAGVASRELVAARTRDQAVRALRYATLDDTAIAALGATDSLLPFVGHDVAALSTLVTEVLAEAEADLA